MIEALILLAAGLAVVFVLLLLSVEWWSTPPGISSFLFAVVAAVVLGLAALRVFGIMLPDEARAIAYAFINVALIGQIVAFLTTRRRARKRRKARLLSRDKTSEVSR